ncbi:MAG: PAS domain S-box protein [Opitutaceae bacterium]|nr:PAS domain S-box protein [Verrucomicrobiales bacterium]
MNNNSTDHELLARVQQENAVLRQTNADLEQRISRLELAQEDSQWKSALLEAQFNPFNDGWLLVDNNAKILLQNQSLADLWKIPPQLIIDSDDEGFLKFVASRNKNPAQFLEKVRYLYAHPGETSHDVLSLVDGTVLDRYSFPCVGKNGTHYGRIWTFRDITEQKLTEEKLAFERELLRELLDNSPDHIYFKDTQSRFIKSSTAQARQFGVASPELLVGMMDSDFFTDEHAGSAFEDEQQIIRTGQPMIAKVEREVWQDGRRESWVTTTKMPLRDKDGGIIGTFGISKDITELKRTEEALRESQALYQSLVQHLHAGIFSKDAAGRFNFVNPYFCQLKQLPADRFLGRTAQEITVEESRNPKLSWSTELAIKGDLNHQQIMQTGRLIEMEEINIKPDGQPQHLHIVKSPVFGSGQKVIGSLGVVFDMTKLKRVEAALVETSTLLETLLMNTTDYIYFKDLQSRFVHFSQSMLEYFDLKRPAELKGKTDFDFFLDENARPAFEAEQEIIRTGKPIFNIEEGQLKLDGRLAWVLTSKMLWSDKAGNVIGTMGISKDISGRKTAEAELEAAHLQLLENSRLAGMAEVATSVLHNVGNVLNSVNVSCAVAADKVRKSRVGSVAKAAALLQEHEDDLAAYFTTDPTGRKLPEYLGKLAARLTEEQAELLQELQSLGKNIEHIKDIVAMQQNHAKVSGITETINASDLAEDSLRMNCESLARHSVQVIRDYQEVPRITVEKHKALQILVNLIRNAKQACIASGRADKQVTLCVARGPGCIRIAIIDNGVGIAPENLTRIFAHGFTTKAEGHGFGLHGAALAAREMGGTLNVQSGGLGQGSTFTLELPDRPASIPSA